MKILKNKKTNYTVTLQIEEDIEKLNAESDKAFNKLVKTTKIKGFRKGKISRSIFEKAYGKEVLIQEAMTNVVNDAYLEAIKELDLKVVDFPKNVDIKEYNENAPISFTCDVDVEPEIKVKKYKGIKVKTTAKKITKEDVETEINKALENYADYKESEKTSEKDDIVRCDLKTTINGEEYPQWTRSNFGLKIGMASFGAEFDEKLVGYKKGKTCSFSLTYPDSFENTDVAGKKLKFDVLFQEVMKKTYPDLTDELVKEKLNGETAKLYKEDTRNRLEEASEKGAKEKLHQDIMDEILKDMKSDIPEKMIENETDNSIKYFETTLSQSGTTMEGFLKMSNKSMDDFKTELKSTSEKKVRIKLILDYIATEEKITVAHDNLIDEVESWNVPEIKSKEDAENYLTRLDTSAVSDSVKQKMVYDFLEKNAKISK
ncbi:trigger factor [bacterium]|jgi:trigger factor|nr:trigger factor [bacterium]